jgi:hypothetical protein
MKKHSIWKPVQDWFKAVGAVGHQHHASQVGEKEEPQVVIQSPRKKKQEPKRKHR